VLGEGETELPFNHQRSCLNKSFNGVRSLLKYSLESVANVDAEDKEQLGGELDLELQLPAA